MHPFAEPLRLVLHSLLSPSIASRDMVSYSSSSRARSNRYIHTNAHEYIHSHKMDEKQEKTSFFFPFFFPSFEYRARPPGPLFMFYRLRACLIEGNKARVPPLSSVPLPTNSARVSLPPRLSPSSSFSKYPILSSSSVHEPRTKDKQSRGEPRNLKKLYNDKKQLAHESTRE
ncbi:uncharacterized protein PV09_06023 [Verruconis gallopava]|uniref:Uncharacterized protein n=1 Tax=Verruconis gallopava TaxID=253628 RepID=A0A0D2A765_9PEZI|nr:uncharacterized protein PV09_06023 [Verruconis gallopava]KIW02568.1 hypothetical protein PV09_06023 [Verruconis gallopava]